MTSVKMQNQIQPHLKKQSFHSELLFGFSGNCWRLPERKGVRKLNPGSRESRAVSNQNDFESHTSKMICLSSMIDFTYQLQWYKRQRETLYGLFKDLACQQNN